MVGINQFKTEEKKPDKLLRVDPSIRERQQEKLNKLRAERDQKTVRECLGQLKSAAETERNLMEPVLEAVKAYATLGEICDVLRDVFGEYQPVTAVS